MSFHKYLIDYHYVKEHLVLGWFMGEDWFGARQIKCHVAPYMYFTNEGCMMIQQERQMERTDKVARLTCIACKPSYNGSLHRIERGMLRHSLQRVCRWIHIPKEVYPVPNRACWTARTNWSKMSDDVVLSEESTSIVEFYLSWFKCTFIS